MSITTSSLDTKKRPEILCSTGCFIGRANQRDHSLILRVQDQICCDAFEFMMYDSWYDQRTQILKDLKGKIKPTPTFHADKTIGELLSRNYENDRCRALEHFKINLEMAQALESKLVVLHLWGGIDSDQKIKNNIEILPKLYELAKKAHILLTIENVVCNQQDPMTHLLEIHQAYPDACFTFDTKMAEFHEQLPFIYQKEWEWLFKENTIRHIHFNDYAGGYMEFTNLKTPQIGTGHVDLQRFASFLHDKVYHGFVTVEATSMDANGAILLSELNRSLALAKTMLCIT